jgi:hypothetical protein
VPSDSFVRQEQFLRVVLLGEFLFVGDEVMDARMAIPANHQASHVHVLFAEAVLEALFAMNPSGNQVMLRQSFLTTAQLAASIVLFLVLGNFRHEHQVI